MARSGRCSARAWRPAARQLRQPVRRPARSRPAAVAWSNCCQVAQAGRVRVACPRLRRTHRRATIALDPPPTARPGQAGRFGTCGLPGRRTRADRASWASWRRCPGCRALRQREPRSAFVPTPPSTTARCLASSTREASQDAPGCAWRESLATQMTPQPTVPGLSAAESELLTWPMSTSRRRDNSGACCGCV